MKITREECIEILQGSIIAEERDHNGKPNGNITCDLTREALDMAIEALKTAHVTIINSNGAEITHIDHVDVLNT